MAVKLQNSPSSTYTIYCEIIIFLLSPAPRKVRSS